MLNFYLYSYSTGFELKVCGLGLGPCGLGLESFGLGLVLGLGLGLGGLGHHWPFGIKASKVDEAQINDIPTAQSTTASWIQMCNCTHLVLMCPRSSPVMTQFRVVLIR